jgi:hypothetical protein
VRVPRRQELPHHARVRHAHPGLTPVPVHEHPPCTHAQAHDTPLRSALSAAASAMQRQLRAYSPYILDQRT